MAANDQARWASKTRVDFLKRSGRLRLGMLLDSFKGSIVVELEGANLGDGSVLAPEVASYELSPVWCRDSITRINEARKLLGLEVGSLICIFAQYINPVVLASSAMALPAGHA